MSDNTEEVVRAPKMEFTLKDFIGIYKEKKKRIFANCLILGILTAVLVYFIIDPIFLSYGTVKTTGKVLGLGMGISVPEISEFGEVLSGSSSSKELALYEDILLSRRCLEEYIVRFGLMEENDYKNMQKAIKDENNKHLSKITGADYFGYFELESFITLMDKCDIIVTQVTMGMHIAIALNKKLVLMNNIFNPNEFELYGNGIIASPDKECKCYFQPECTNKEYQCMDHLTPEKIFSECERLADELKINESVK